MYGQVLMSWVLVADVLAAFQPVWGQDKHRVVPLPQAHAHNDYRHPRPLLDALDRGFCSVEADIFLVNGELLVGHDREELREGRTLQTLYLDPLRRRAQQYRGRVYPNGPTITLLVDIKADGERAYVVLRDVLASYEDKRGDHAGTLAVGPPSEQR